MPTVLFLYGWRFFFYSNEANEPLHIHCQKAEKECKFWLNEKEFNIEEVFSFNLKPTDYRIIKKAIYENFDYIVSEWKKLKK